jgi:cell division septation protein DedD
MRNIFLALVLANLAFAAWHTWFASAPPPVRGDDGLPKITLVKELPADVSDLPVAGDAAAANAPGGAAEQRASSAAESTAPAAAEPASPADPLSLTAAMKAAASARNEPAPPSPEPGAAADATRCTSIGPFRELAQAATAAANLRAAGYEPTQRVAEGDIWIGYWVYIEAIAKEGDANEILAKVRAEGVTDSYVIPNSDSGNLVSLGVFSEISGVSRRREQVRALGYEPKVVDRTRRATVYWVDVLLRAEQSLDFDSLQTPGRIIRLEQRACEAPAA